MKNKQDNATKAADKGAWVPKLRFPEFQGTGGWLSKPMGEIYSYMGSNSLSRDKLNYERGSVKNIHYGDIHTKFSTLFDITKEVVPYVNSSEPIEFFKAENYCAEGDMIFADASEDLTDIGKSIELIKLNDERVVSGLHTILARQSAASLVLGFGGYLFKSYAIRKQIQKESQGAKVLGLSGSRLAKIIIPFPSNKAEQKKIADCLASVDERIALEAQKLSTLKTHKKGLMQQLFPSEGETMPQLRFPEFRDAGEWEMKPLKKLFIIGNGRDYKHLSTGNIPVYGSGGYMLSVDKHLYDGESVCVGRKGTINNPMFFAGKFWAVDTLFYTHSFNDCLPKFIYAVFQNIEWLKHNEAGGIPSLSKKNIEKIEVAVPNPGEQQKIAECLASIDACITAQAKKIDALKIHKKGLMQQIFAMPNEVDA